MLTNTQIKQARAFTNVSLRYREKLKRLKGGGTKTPVAPGGSAANPVKPSWEGGNETLSNSLSEGMQETLRRNGSQIRR